MIARIETFDAEGRALGRAHIPAETLRRSDPAPFAPEGIRRNYVFKTMEPSDMESLNVAPSFGIESALYSLTDLQIIAECPVGGCIQIGVVD